MSAKRKYNNILIVYLIKKDKGMNRVSDIKIKVIQKNRGIWYDVEKRKYRKLGPANDVEQLEKK